MTAIIKNKFRLKNAKSFIENFDIPQTAEDIRSVLSDSTLPVAARSVFQDILNKVPDRNHYLFIGKPIGWAGSADTDTNSYGELNPPPPTDAQDADARVWDEMLGLKKITRGDVSLVIPRSDWRPNTVYAPFDDQDVDLYNQPTPSRIQEEKDKTSVGQPMRHAGNFYALNRLMDLFICVDNNKNSISTVEPTRPPTTGTSSGLTGRITTQDGYVWQYITSIGPGDAVKFLTDSWIPVKTLPENANLDHPQEDVQANAIPGELLRVVLTSDAQTGNFTNIYAGKIQRVAQDTTKITFVQSSTNPTPSALFEAYKGYEIHITIPEVTGVSPRTVKRYKIKEYVSSPVPLLTLDRAVSDLNLTDTYECEILPHINVQTNGTQISVKPIVNIAGGVTGVEILDPGANATTVTLVVEKPAVFDGNVPTLRAVLSPPLGLGKDPESDLGAFYGMVSTQLRYDDGGDFPVANDYRQIGIIRDVKKKVKNSSNEDVVVLATENSLSAITVVNVQFLSIGDLGPQEIGFQSDDEVEVRLSTDPTTTVGRARVVQFVRNPDVSVGGSILISGKLYLIQTKDTGYYKLEEGQLFITSPGVNQVKGVSFSTTTPAEAAVIKEEFLKFHGHILYLENRRAVLRAQDQIEDIKTIIEF